MALLPPFYLNTVVALGSPSQDGKIQYNATGFAYGYPAEKTSEEEKQTYRVFLVTNRHVLQNSLDSGIDIKVRFNKAIGAAANVYTLRLTNPDGSTSWAVHPDSDIDVAVVNLNTDRLKSDGIEFSFFAADDHTFTHDQAREKQVSEGDGVFVLGFPLGEAGDERNYAIVRQGIIARVQDWLVGNARTFLIDSSIFPGNSGGPVLLKPESTFIEGTKANHRCGLIGIVSSYLPYREVAVSVQTGRTRMIFEENSGLGVVVPRDMIHETIRLAVDKHIESESTSPAPEVRGT